jgi:hypothetical protein
MAGFLLERYWPGVTSADVQTMAVRLARLGDADARFVASTLVPLDEVVFFEFDGADAAAVLALAGRAGLRSDRLMSAERVVSHDRRNRFDH